MCSKNRDLDVEINWLKSCNIGMKLVFTVSFQFEFVFQITAHTKKYINWFFSLEGNTTNTANTILNKAQQLLSSMFHLKNLIMQLFKNHKHCFCTDLTYEIWNQKLRKKSTLRGQLTALQSLCTPCLSQRFKHKPNDT